MKRSTMAGKIVWKTLVMISEMDACQGIVDGCKFLLLFFFISSGEKGEEEK